MTQRSTLAAALAAVAFSGAALAADLRPSLPDEPEAPPAARFDWSGGFAGIHAGGARAVSKAKELRTMGDDPTACAPGGRAGAWVCNVNGAPRAVPTPTPSFNMVGDEWSLKTKGGLIGVHAGYNVQRGDIVAGIVADWSRMNLRGTSGPSPASIDDTTLQVNATDLVTARARLGYAFDRLLLSVSAGAAIANFGANVRDPDLPIGIFTERSGSQVGLALGVGVDYALTDRLMLRADLQTVRFGNSRVEGSINLSCVTGAAVCNPAFWKTDRLGMVNGSVAAWHVRHTVNLMNVGLSYKF